MIIHLNGIETLSTDVDVELDCCRKLMCIDCGGTNVFGYKLVKFMSMINVHVRGMH